MGSLRTVVTVYRAAGSESMVRRRGPGSDFDRVFISVIEMNFTMGWQEGLEKGASLALTLF